MTESFLQFAVSSDAGHNESIRDRNSIPQQLLRPSLAI